MNFHNLLVWGWVLVYSWAQLHGAPRSMSGRGPYIVAFPLDRAKLFIHLNIACHVLSENFLVVPRLAPELAVSCANRAKQLTQL